jgi:cyclopropane fatty-acyl-phospholipid synthase-like methyltransferase
MRAMTRWTLFRSFRYKKHRTSSTDYVAEFDHTDLRRAKASILWFEDWDTATRNHMRILDRLGLVRPGYTVLDYGCGVGRITQVLAERGDVRVIAVDRSADMRRHANNYVSRRFLNDGTVQILSDVEILDEVSDRACSVDTLLLIEVLQHIPEPIIEDLLPKLLTILKPGGRVFVFGNLQLDVGADGGVFPDTPTVESILSRFTEVCRRDVWAEDFSDTRISFVCRSLDATALSGATLSSP